MIAGWILLAQAAGPTVGDTVWIERLVGAATGAVIRPQEWDLEPEGTQLGPAVVSHGAAGATVRYPVVLWFPGDRSLTMPGPVLVYPDGTSDTLPASTHRIRVGSVLPAGQPKRTIPPRPLRNPVPLATRSLVPLAVLVGGSGLFLAGLVWRWRRDPKPAARATPVAREPDPATLRRWADLGEYRAALHHWGWRLAGRLSRSQDISEMAALQRRAVDRHRAAERRRHQPRDRAR